MDSLREQSIEAFEVVVERMPQAELDAVGVEQQRLRLAVEQKRLEPSDMGHILNDKTTISLPVDL